MKDVLFVQPIYQPKPCIKFGPA